MPVMNINLFSITLRYGIDCMVVLPENLKKGEKLKCLWLYHGGSGDHTAWLYHTPLVELAEEKHFAAVLPNVHESCFVNMNIGDAFGTFVGKELPSVIWNMFACISGERQDNYIAGFSNGGYGCLHTALSYPQNLRVSVHFRQAIRRTLIFHHLQSKKAGCCCLVRAIYTKMTTDLPTLRGNF